MSISVEDDPDDVGHAIVRLDSDNPGSLSLSFRFLDKTYLGPDGRRTRKRHCFPGTSCDDTRQSFRLGPDVTAHIREAEIVEIADIAGVVLGKIVWEGIRAPLESGQGAPIKYRPRTAWGARGKPTAPPEHRIPQIAGEAAPNADESETAGTDALSEEREPETPPLVNPAPSRPEYASLVVGTCLLILSTLPPLLILSGVIGWQMQPINVSAIGMPGGPFAPAMTQVRFERSWYVKPFARLFFGEKPPFLLDSAPAWLHLSQREIQPSIWTLDVAAASDATGTLTVGPHPFLAQLAFPLRSAASAVGCAITLLIEQPGTLMVTPNNAIQFEGPRGGPFRPPSYSLTLSNPHRPDTDWQVADVPDWLEVTPHAGRLSRDANLAIAVRPNAVALGLDGTTDARLQISSGASALPVRIIIDPLQHVTSAIDDIACDRVAGNRFDPDHPADRGSRDEIADLTATDLEKGLGYCDPSTARQGHDRRYAVQRARLLAERAVRSAVGGDMVSARRDMNEAIAIWETETAAGSAYAGNFLGAYYKGTTFNRPGYEFIQPDEQKASAYWVKAMQAGSIIAQRNYAAQLLSGLGVNPDPDGAFRLLEDALNKGDERAAGILGVALYTGFPAGVTRDKERGWALVVRAQCLDKAARTLLNREITRGAQSSADRHVC